MEKIKTTKKYIKANYHYIFNSSGENIDYLLTGIDPRYYNAGVYGWNWDGYELTENICIIAGYRNTLGENISREILANYEKQAKKIFETDNLTYDKKLYESKKLRNEFINQILNIN